MKTLAKEIIFFVMASIPLFSQDLEGQWNGSLDVQGTVLRVVFHVTKLGTQYKATMDSPDQNVSGIPVTAVSFTPPDVKFEISNLGMVYEGTISDSQITGKWMQSGQTFLLTLLKAENPSDRKN